MTQTGMDGDIRGTAPQSAISRLRPCALALGVVIATSACQTVPQVPDKRPLTAEARMALAETDVVMTGMHRGVGMGWDSMRANQNPDIFTLLFQANPAVAALGQAAMVTVMDAGPSGRAKRNANELNAAFQNYDLSKQLKGHIRREMTEVEGMELAEVTASSTPQMVLDMTDVMGIRTSYVLSEDATAIKVTADVWIDADDIPYETPYEFGDYVPRVQRDGPIYANRFVYVTDRMELPRLSYTLRDQLIADIERAYEGRQDDRKAMKRKAKELEDAADDKLSKSEASMFLVRQWADNDAELLLAELDRAHAWLASRIKQDMASGEVPTFAGGRHKSRIDGTGRVETIVGFGPKAGAYISEPSIDVDKPPLSFGNAVKIAVDNRGFDGGF